MSFILQPWQLFFIILAGWVNRQQQEAIEYLRTENQVLKEKLGKKRILLNDDQRRRLAVKGKILGRKRLEEMTVEGSSGGGAVRVTMNGQRDVLKIAIDPGVVEDGDALVDVARELDRLEEALERLAVVVENDHDLAGGAARAPQEVGEVAGQRRRQTELAAVAVDGAGLAVVLGEDTGVAALRRRQGGAAAHAQPDAPPLGERPVVQTQQGPVHARDPEK